MAEQSAWATPAEIAKPWRPLSTSERDRAEALIASAQRDIVRRYPSVPRRLRDQSLPREDVVDVLTWLVLPVLGGPPHPGARSWQVTSGSESRSLTLATSEVGSAREPWVYAQWMVDILEGTTGKAQALPRGSFPRADRFESLFPEWPERP